MNSLRLTFFLFCLSVALIVVATTPAAATGLAVEGVDESRILPPSGVIIESYQNAGYSLELRDGEAHVRVDALPLDSRSPFNPPEEIVENALGRLARALTITADTEFEAASSILSWVARNIEYRLDREQSQDAEDVLRRRSGYCTGVARLTVALLEAVGLPAREVAGYVIESGWAGDGEGFHRWIEIKLSDRGWVFSDPLRSHHFVASTYLRLASDQLQPREGLDGLLLERDDRITAVDLYPMATPGILARRNSGKQLAAALRVLIAEQPKGTAILVGDTEQLTHALIDGGTTFVGLEPGTYRLRLILAERGVLERQIDIVDRSRIALFLPAPRRQSPSGHRQMNSRTE